MKRHSKAGRLIKRLRKLWRHAVLDRLLRAWQAIEIAIGLLIARRMARRKSGLAKAVASIDLAHIREARRSIGLVRHVRHDAEVADPLFIRFGGVADFKIRRHMGISAVLSSSPPSLTRTAFLNTLASMLKWSGQLRAARGVYLLLQTMPHGKALSYLGLSDLALLEANWISEVAAYAPMNAWVDPNALFGQQPRFLSADKGDHRQLRRAAELLAKVSSRDVQLCDDRLVRRWIRILERLGRVGNINTAITSDWHVIQNARKGPVSAFLYRIGHTQCAADAARTEHSDKPIPRDAVSFPGVAWIKPNRALSVVEVLPLEQIGRRLGIAVQRLSAEVRIDYEICVVGDGRVVRKKIDRVLPPVISGAFPKARDMGYGLMLIDDNFLAQDTKHLPFASAKVFSPDIWSASSQRAVVELDRVAPILRGGSNVHRLVGNENYYHWLIETLGDFAATSEKMNNAEVVTYQSMKSYQRDMLAAFVPQSRVRNCLIQWPHQYVVDEIQITTRWSRDQVVHPSAMAALRARSPFNPLPSRDGRAKRRIYLQRSAARRLQIGSEAAIVRILASHGFETIDPAQLELSEQAALFAQCEVIAGPGGAAFSNLMYCTPGTKILVLAPETGAFDTFGSLAASFSCAYWLVLGKVDRVILNPQFIWTEQQFSIDPRDLELALKEMGLT